MAYPFMEDLESPSPGRNSKGLKRLLLAVVVLLLLGGILMFAAKAFAVFYPGLISVRFIDLVERPGGTFLRVAITKIGTSPVFRSGTMIEPSGGGKRFEITSEPFVVLLRAGEGNITEFRLPDQARRVLNAKWRVSCYCGDIGIRSWIFWWRFQPDGFGAEVTRVLPKGTIGMPVSIMGRSDWNEPVPPSSTDPPPTGH